LHAAGGWSHARLCTTHPPTHPQTHTPNPRPGTVLRSMWAACPAAMPPYPGVKISELLATHQRPGGIAGSRLFAALRDPVTKDKVSFRLDLYGLTGCARPAAGGE